MQFLGESGDITPVSFGSELELNIDAPVSRTDCDETVTEDVNMSASTSDSLSFENNTLFQNVVTPKAVTPSTENINVCRNIFQLTPANLKHVENIERKVFVNRIYNEFEDKNTMRKTGNLSRSSSLYEKDTTNANKNLSTSGSSKWCTEKEKFLETTRNLELVKAQYLERSIDMLKNLNIDCDKSKVTKEATELSTSKMKTGAVVIKEKYIEPPKVSRISRSFHGKSNTASSLDTASSPRRASDSVSLVNLNPEKESTEKVKASCKKKIVAQLSHPSGSSLKLPSQSTEYRKNSLTDNVATKPRFTTRIVDEAEHAASVGLTNYQRKNDGNTHRSQSDTEEK